MPSETSIETVEREFQIDVIPNGVLDNEEAAICWVDEMVRARARDLEGQLGIEYWAVLTKVGNVCDIARARPLPLGNEGDEVETRLYADIPNHVIKLGHRKLILPSPWASLQYHMGRLFVQGHRSESVALRTFFCDHPKIDSLEFGRLMHSMPHIPIIFAPCDVSIQVWGKHDPNCILTYIAK